MEVVPKDIAYAVAKMDTNSNVFRLETNGATTAGPSSIVTLTLPSNCVVDLRSFKVHLDIATTSDATSTNAIAAKLPADTSSLIQQCEVYCGGISVASGFSEFNTVSKVKKIVNSSRDRDGSLDGTLSHGVISTTDGIEEVSCIFKPSIGLFAESSTRYISTALTGDISVRLTLASNAVLTYKEVSVAMARDFTDAAARAAALNPTYSCVSIHATIATCTFGDMYERMLLDRLSAEDFLPVNYKEYYTFSLMSTQGTAHDVRFSLSASSIDRIYSVCRDSNYQNAGIRTRAYSGASLSDANCANFFHFKAYNNSTTARGTLRYRWNVNNVTHPMYDADVLDAAHEMLMISDQHGHTGRGNMVSSLLDYNDGKAVFPLQLCMPGQPLNVQSGYNSRGNNTQFSFSLQGQVIPAADADAQTTAAISTMVIAETTAQMRIAGAKQISISY